MNLRSSLLAALVLVTVAVPARADVRLLIMDMDPEPTATLARGERFALRVEYTVDRPVRIRGEAYNGDRQVTAMTGGSPRYDAGSGEALVWFAWTTPTRIDRIVVRAADEGRNQVLAEAERPVRLTATGRPSPARRGEAAWVTRLQADQTERFDEQLQQIGDVKASGSTDFLFDAMLLWGAPVYLLLQGVALWRMRRGWWRVAALVPAVPMALVFGFTILGMFAGASLFPLVLIFTSPPAALYLVVLVVAHAFSLVPFSLDKRQ